MICKRCGKEFETNDGRRKYCSPLCSKRPSKINSNTILGGCIKRKGNTITVTGVLNCMLFMNSLRK